MSHGDYFHDKCKKCNDPIKTMEEALNYDSWWYHKNPCWEQELEILQKKRNKI